VHGVAQFQTLGIYMKPLFIILSLPLVALLIFIILYTFPTLRSAKAYRIRALFLLSLSFVPVILPYYISKYSPVINRPLTDSEKKNPDICKKYNEAVQSEEKSKDAFDDWIEETNKYLNILSVITSFFCASLGANLFMYGYTRQQHYKWVRSNKANIAFDILIQTCARINRFISKEMRR